MGLAILYIMLYHQDYVQGFPVQPFARFGGWGVEVFMFVSGMGIAYSLGKNSLQRYFSNRAWRILPAYGLAVAALAGLLYMAHGGLGRKEAADIVNHWWFIKAIILFYLLAPVFKTVLERYAWKGFWGIVSADIFVLWASCAYAKGLADGCLFDWLRICYEGTSRMPAFLLGMAMILLPGAAEGTTGKGWRIALAPLLLLAITARIITAGKAAGSIPSWMVLDRELAKCVFFGQRILICFLMPVICYAVARVLHPFKGSCIIKFLSFCGSISLELYLVHELVFVNGAPLFAGMKDGGVLSWLAMAGAFLLSLAAAWLLHLLCPLFLKPSPKKR